MLKGPEYCHSSLKSKFDKYLAAGVFPLTSPVWATMYLYNRCRCQPLLFNQQRVGQNLEPVTIYKFETLHAGDENSPEEEKRLHTSSGDREKTDPRTPNKFMALMRCSGLNEIPQLLNILQGNLSFVGPRPVGFKYLNEAAELFPDTVKDWKKTAATIKPGLVGVSPLTTRRLPVTEFDRQARMDMWYFENSSIWTDCCILGQAMVAIAKG